MAIIKRSRSPKGSDFIIEDQTLQFICGQRGKQLLLFDGFTFAKNNVVGKTTYWCCRSRRGGNPCKARLFTVQKSQDLYQVTVKNSFHNHEPTRRMIKKLERHMLPMPTSNFEECVEVYEFDS